jgi:ubiquinone/menaquinone biosynthesis C-methylase UbiE
MYKALVKFLQRADKKAEWVDKHIGGSPTTILDLGCGEGNVGYELSRKGFDVTLADVADFHVKSHTLPFVLYGETLPFADKEFDVVLLYFVLHHAEDQTKVLREAVRVGKRIIIVESVYRSSFGKRVLVFLDILFNRLRGSGILKGQEEYLYFRNVPEWKKLFRDMNLHVYQEASHGNFIHRQHTFVVTSY